MVARRSESLGCSAIARFASSRRGRASAKEKGRQKGETSSLARDILIKSAARAN